MIFTRKEIIKRHGVENLEGKNTSLYVPDRNYQQVSHEWCEKKWYPMLDKLKHITCPDHNLFQKFLSDRPFNKGPYFDCDNFAWLALVSAQLAWFYTAIEGEKAQAPGVFVIGGYFNGSTHAMIRLDLLHYGIGDCEPQNLWMNFHPVIEGKKYEVCHFIC